MGIPRCPVPRGLDSQPGCSADSSAIRRRRISTISGSWLSSFRIERLATKRIVLHVDHPYFRRLRHAVDTDSEGVELRLEDGETITGMLHDAAGKPAAKHTVWAVDSVGAVRQARTAADGTFVVRGLAPGACRVGASRKLKAVHADAESGATGVVLRLPPK